jgi:hypothetical protein
MNAQKGYRNQGEGKNVNNKKRSINQEVGEEEEEEEEEKEKKGPLCEVVQTP